MMRTDQVKAAKKNVAKFLEGKRGGEAVKEVLRGNGVIALAVGEMVRDGDVVLKEQKYYLTLRGKWAWLRK